MVDQQLVNFDLANENYGIDIAAVDGIIKMQEITTVPNTPAFVEGVTNLRGSVLPVIDLRKRFGLPQVDASRDTRIVVVNMGHSKVGMIVDGVSEVLTIPESAIEPTPPMVTTVDSAFIIGIAKVEERLIILVDLTKILNTEEQKSLQAVPVLA
jgi:purine-binding chemotaxis protein CheW